MNTREKILHRVHADLQINGFQGLRADRLIKELNITKGALYYYFSTKKELCYSVIEELVQPTFLEPLIPVLEWEGDPLMFLETYWIGVKNRVSEAEIQHGHVLFNLAQEMSALDEGFKTRVDFLLQSGRDLIAAALTEGQNQGYVRSDLNAKAVAAFIQAHEAGAYTLAKAAQDKKIFDQQIDLLIEYGQSLRA